LTKGFTVYRYRQSEDHLVFYVGKGQLSDRPTHSMAGDGHNQAVNERIQRLGARGFYIECIWGPANEGLEESEAQAIERCFIEEGGAAHKPEDPGSLLNVARDADYAFRPYVDLRSGLDPLPEPDQVLSNGLPYLTWDQLAPRLGASRNEVGIVTVNPSKLARVANQRAIAAGAPVPDVWRAEWCLRYWSKHKGISRLVAVTVKDWGSVIVGSYEAQQYIQSSENRRVGTYLPSGGWAWADVPDGDQVDQHPLEGQGASWVHGWNTGGVCGYVLPPPQRPGNQSGRGWASGTGRPANFGEWTKDQDFERALRST